MLTRKRSSLITQLQSFIYLTLEKNATPFGVLINSFLISLIVLSLFTYVFATEPEYLAKDWFYYFCMTVDYVCMVVFTLELALRGFCITSPLNPEVAKRGAFKTRVKFIFSFHVLIDIVSVIPSYVQLLLIIINYNDFNERSIIDENHVRTSAQYHVARGMIIVRILRVFRLLKGDRYVGAWSGFASAIAKKKRELFVAAFMTFAVTLFVSSIMYYLERDANKEVFGSIPRSMYWAVITLATVGYGDATPSTRAGKAVAGLTAAIAIGLFAFPTSILGSAFVEEISSRDAGSNSGSQSLGTATEAEVEEDDITTPTTGTNNANEHHQTQIPEFSCHFNCVHCTSKNVLHFTPFHKQAAPPTPSEDVELLERNEEF